MKPSDRLYQFTKSWEKFSNNAYKPTPNDEWTIGWGFTFVNGKAVKKGDYITQQDADNCFKGYMNQTAYELTTRLSPDQLAKLSQNKFDAVCDFVYNLGITKFLSYETGKLFFQGQDIGSRFTKFDEQDGQVLQGLLDRRLAEQVIYQQGVYKDHQ